MSPGIHSWYICNNPRVTSHKMEAILILIILLASRYFISDDSYKAYIMIALLIVAVNEILRW